jgi:hypothetical protein
MLGELKMDERDASWHVAQVVTRRLAIAREADRQTPGSTRSQPLDEFFERVDHHFVSLDDGRNRLHAAALEQQRHRRATAQVGPPTSGTEGHQFSLSPCEVANRNGILLACLAPLYVTSMSVPLNRRCSGERSSLFMIGFIILKIHSGTSGLPGSSPACGRSVLFRIEKESCIVTRFPDYFHEHVLVHCRWRKPEA